MSNEMMNLDSPSLVREIPIDVVQRFDDLEQEVKELEDELAVGRRDLDASTSMFSQHRSHRYQRERETLPSRVGFLSAEATSNLCVKLISGRREEDNEILTVATIRASSARCKNAARSKFPFFPNIIYGMNR